MEQASTVTSLPSSVRFPKAGLDAVVRASTGTQDPPAHQLLGILLQKQSCF